MKYRRDEKRVDEKGCIHQMQLLLHITIGAHDKAITLQGLCSILFSCLKVLGLASSTTLGMWLYAR